ncbi:MAG: hypothetical protein NTY45_14600 [Elusimicrobia bacterium]|nr:hypothetical protein [Elusimicrobiota bacterium]
MPRKTKVLSGLAAAAVAWHLFAGIAFIRSAAPAAGEPAQLAGGYSCLVTGSCLMNAAQSPRLAELLSALPLTALKPRSFISHPYFANVMPHAFGDLFLYQNSVPAERLLNTSRYFTFFLWTFLFILFLYILAAGLGGTDAALAAVIIFCFMPVFLASDTRASTDAAAAAFFLGAVAAAFRFCRQPAAAAVLKKKSRPVEGRFLFRWAALAGLLAGLAMASGFSMVSLAPLIAGLWLADAYLNRGLKPRRVAWYTVVFLAQAGFIVALVYRFRPGLYLEEFSAALSGLGQARSYFVWGHYPTGGAWWSLPLAFAVKTPLAVLFLAGAGIFARFKKNREFLLWAAVPPAVYFVVLAGTGRPDYGHLLPIMPFAALAAGLGADHINKGRKYYLAAVGVLLSLSWGFLMFRAHPHYTAYFNELAGGPAGGYRFFVESALDRGQEIKTLAAYLEREGNPPVILSYFGAAHPENYGIKYVPLETSAYIELAGSGASVCATATETGGMKKLLLAVSATNLQGVYSPDKETFAWLKVRKPVFTAGYSIFLYDLTADRDGIERMAALFDREGRNAEADCLYKRAGAAER